MQRPGSTDDSSWSDALADAARRLPSDVGGAALFLEEREDLTVEMNGHADEVVCTRTRIRGLAARGPFGRGTSVYKSHPNPSDVARLTTAVASGEIERESDEAATPAEPWHADGAPSPATSHSTELVEWAVVETNKLHPSAEVRARWIGFDQFVRIALPGGVVVHDRRRGARMRLEASVAAGDYPVTAVEEAVGLDLDAAEVTAMTSRVAARLTCRVGARPATPGRRTVVFGPGVGGVLVHEVVGHALEGDIYLARGSWLAGQGERDTVASRELTVIDDPRRGRGAWKIDDEGQQSRPTPLIRSGRVAGWLSDLECARRSRRPPTGHGRRASYREPVMPRMGCTFVAAGRFDPAEVLDSIDDGVYVRRMEAASTDPASGVAVFRVTDADRIRNGGIEAPLRPHLLRIDARESLSKIDRIADDLRFDPCVGSCVRDGQPLSISVGAPTFRIGLATVFS